MTEDDVEFDLDDYTETIPTPAGRRASVDDTELDVYADQPADPEVEGTEGLS